MEKKKYTYRVWDDKTQNTGVESIDKYHKHFVEIINLLVTILNQGSDKENLVDVFHKLVFYAENYFIDEELYYQKNNFPELKKHKEQHNEFCKQILTFQQAYTQNNLVCEDLMKYLDKWFKNHILQGDKETVDFIQKT